MKGTTWIGALVVLGIVVVLAGCGKKDSTPSGSSPAAGAEGPPPGGPTAPAPQPEKPKTDAKVAEDDSDDPWFGEKKTVTGAVGKALLRGLTGGGGGAKKDDIPTLIK